MKNPIHKIIPSNFNNLIGLTRRLLAERNAAGKAAMLYSLAGLLMMPLDWIFRFSERKLYRKASRPKLPLIFVCGPPRSGTTLVSQVLIKHLPVYYFNNLTSIFPDSPIISNIIFRRFLEKSNADVTFKSLYGRTSHLWSPNDALYLWDRWTGVARNEIPAEFNPENRLRIQRFFSAVEIFSGKPLVNKNNKLNTYANLVADCLDTAYFICLDRDPVYLAQSLLIASRFINGDEKIPYGVDFCANQHTGNADSLDPVEQVCTQVQKYRNISFEQEKLIGSKRFIIVPYEDFCADPAKWVCHISDEILGQRLNLEVLRQKLHPFNLSNNVKIEPALFSRIKHAFEQKIVKK